jgi:hypothetical protein
MSGVVSNLLDKVFLSPTQKVEGDLNSYIKALESGKFKDKVVFGISDSEKGFHYLDPVMQPGALFCGGMGSGKSIAMRFTVATHIATNSENTFYILVDTLKGMNDYVQLFKDETDDFGNIIKENPYKRNVVAAINDSAKIVPVIDMVYEECMARKEEFSNVGANNIYSYDSIMKDKDKDFKGIARMMICIEEFHAIPNSPQVRFAMKVDQQGSIASKLKELMRVGRSYGICFMFATQRATSEDVPSQLKPGLSMMMAFRMNNPGEASSMNLPHAQEIGVKQRGRCAYEDGFIQYPYISDDILEIMLKKYYKPLIAKLLKGQPEDYHKALAGEGNDGMVWIKPYKDIIKFSNQYDIKTIATRLLKDFNIEVEIQPNETFVADMIGTKYDDKYAIRLINNREQGSKKEVEALIRGAEVLKCNKILVIVSEISPPMGVNSLEKNSEVDAVVLDNDDLIQIANMLDNRAVLEKEGKFHEFYLRYGISDIKDLENDSIETVGTNVIETANVSEEIEEDYKIIEDISESISNRIEVNEKLPVEPIVSETKNIKEQLKEEREAYKAKLKSDRKQFLETIDKPILKEKKEDVTFIEDNAEVASVEEIKEVKNEQNRKEDNQESLDKDVLLKIRERLKQNILDEREA